MHLPRIIVLSGGGVKAVAHIGALQRLEAAGTLAAVRTWVGLSAGAITALGVCLGYSLASLHDICDRFDFAALQDPAPQGFLAFLDNYGIDTGEKLTRFVAALLTVRGFGADLTFAQLAEATKKELRVVATNMTTGRAVIYSAATTPDARVVDGVRASMSLPFYFWPHRDAAGHLLVDGGVHGFYPMNTLSVEEQKHALGIFIMQNVDEWKDTGPDSYILRLYEITSQAKSELLASAHKERTIVIKTPPISMIEFSLTVEQRTALYDSGTAAADTFLEGLKRRPRRRNSLSA